MKTNQKSKTKNQKSDTPVLQYSNTPIRKVHFIGIGGSGMSALAEICLGMGLAVSGSDLSSSRKLIALAGKGAVVCNDHAPENVRGADLVVHSTAIHSGNVELREAERIGIPLLGRARALALLCEGRRILAVVGTHGKTTTSAMVARILLEAGWDPLVAVGGHLSFLDGNGCFGMGGWAVIELDESDGTMKDFEVDRLVLTSLDKDHLDYYGSLEAIRAAFSKLAGQARPGALMYGNIDERNVSEALDDSGRPWIACGMENAAVWSAKKVDLKGKGSWFTLVRDQDHLSDIILRVPGRHNVQNALMAAAVCVDFGIDPRLVSSALSDFGGVQRRFQILGEFNGMLVVDDYAHHPTEIRTTLEAAHRIGETVLAVFQPHRYSRTAELWRDFAAALEGADEVVVTPVYPAGEDPVAGVTSTLIVDALHACGRNRAICLEMQHLKEWMLSVGRSGDIALFMGAGDLHKTAEKIVGSGGREKQR